MNKKIYVQQALVFFVSIHILIAWVAERKGSKIEQNFPVLPSKSAIKNIDKQNLSVNIASV